MKRNYIAEVIRLFFKGTYPEETEKKVQHWLIEDLHGEEKERILQNEWEALEIEPDIFVYESWEAVKKKIHTDQPVRKHLNPAYRFLRIAAVLLPFLLLLGGYLYFSGNSSDKWIVVQVPHGERQQVLLPDGTDVWINAGSTLAYPEFTSDVRKVRLSGEAWFSVVKDSLHPFIVETSHLSVQVLGTEFNVSAYPEDEQTITTLHSGKVRIHTAGEQIVELAPSQQLVYYNHTEQTILESVIPEETSAWISGQLIFEHLPLTEIFKILERHFNVTIESDSSLLSKPDVYTTRFDTDESLTCVLAILGELCSFSYRIEGEKVIIRENN